MKGKHKDALHVWLDREIAALEDGAKRGAEPRATRMRTLASIAELARIRDAAHTENRGKWWAAAAFGATLVLASVLLFARVHETDIELKLTATELSFTLAADQVVTAGILLSRLGIAGLSRVDWPTVAEGSAEGPTLIRESPAVSLTAVTREGRQGTVTLDTVLLPAGTRITVHDGSSTADFQLIVSAPHLIVRAIIIGPVLVGVVGGRAGVLDSPIPKAISVTAGKDGLDIDLAFPALPQRPLASQLKVRDIAASRIDQFIGTQESIVRRLSTIISGDIYFESLNGEKRGLRRGEELRFAASAGDLRDVELTDAGVALQFHGRVGGMVTGAGNAERTLMPTYLEWLQARHGLALLWGSALYLFGLVAAALRWWGVRM